MDQDGSRRRSSDPDIGKRTRYPPEYKAKVAPDPIRDEQTPAELSSKHGVHPHLIGQWKRQAIEHMSTLFGGGDAETVTERKAEVEKLYVKIGQLLMERGSWAKAFGR